MLKPGCEGTQTCLTGWVADGWAAGSARRLHECPQLSSLPPKTVLQLKDYYMAREAQLDQQGTWHGKRACPHCQGAHGCAAHQPCHAGGRGAARGRHRPASSASLPACRRLRARPAPAPARRAPRGRAGCATAPRWRACPSRRAGGWSGATRWATPTARARSRTRRRRSAPAAASTARRPTGAHHLP